MLEKSEMPYEKFTRFGPEALTDIELLAIMIRSGTHNASALCLAREILHRESGKSGDLSLLCHMSVKELMQIRGIGEIKAVKIKCIVELSMRMAKYRAIERLSFENASSIAAYYMEDMRHLEVEKIILILLDNKLRLMEEYVISIGTVNASILSTRDVFQKALRGGACRIVLLHNHPSGDARPSRQDIEITLKIQKAGEIMDIELLDHIILGDGEYFSIREHDLL